MFLFTNAIETLRYICSSHNLVKLVFFYNKNKQHLQHHVCRYAESSEKRNNDFFMIYFIT